MSGKFSNKLALITGSSRGIGRAGALAFAREGATLIGVYYASNADAAHATIREIEDLGSKGVAIKADLSRGREATDSIWEQFKAAAVAAMDEPRLDILVNNAGVAPAISVSQARERGLRRVRRLTLDYLVNYHAAMGRISNAKERLMAAATELTWQKGYNGVTVDDICERAGVRKGSFYYFFKSKAALSIAAMDNWWQTQARPNLDSVFSASHPPLERIKAYFEMLHQHYLDQKNTGGRMLGCPFFSLAMEGGGLEPEVLQASQQYVKRKRKYLEAAIRDAQAEGVIRISSVEEAAQGLQTLVEGAVALSRVQNDLEPLRTLYKEALRLLGATQPVATV